MNSRYLLTGIILVAVLTGTVFFVKKNRMPTEISHESSDSKVKGPLDAPIQIVEYSDFQCPAYQKSEEPLHKILDSYPDKIRFVFRHFPLQGHRWSGIAHQAAECSNKFGYFWEYHDRLYAEQAQWSVSPDPTQTFLEYARDLPSGVREARAFFGSSLRL